MPAVETEQPPPKPKKFFKSRNAEPYPPVPQITYAPPVPAAPLSPEHPSNSKEKKSQKRSRAYNRDSSSPELPRRNSEKTKAKKSTVATKAAKKEEVPENSQPPNKRYLVRNRDKVINYAEDGSNSPIPDFTSRYETIPPKIPSPKVPTPKVSPLVSSPTPSKPDVASPSTSKEANEERKPPPIVLRISKGTSRIVSTDSNEGFTSPISDRHSSMDTHSDIGSDHKKSPSVDTICSPKHEGLKITIKCAGLNQEIKKEKKKEKHKSHKKHHKNTDDESNKKVISPLPGSDAYELYKTLASPPHENEKESKNKLPAGDDIESKLAQLDSPGSVIKSPRLEVHPNDPPPEPKPPESTTGRSRRNRPNINYSENDDYLDVLTSGYPSKYSSIKTVGDLKKEVRKSRRKQENEVIPTVSSPVNNISEKMDTNIDKNDLIDILSGGDDPGKNNEIHKGRVHKKQKNKHKHASPEHESKEVPENIDESQTDTNDLEVEPENEPVENQDVSVSENQTYSQPTQSSDSAYNSGPNENSEEEVNKNTQDDVFKSPHGLCDSEEQLEEKPSVKLVITKKKGSIFKSKSLVNDNPSPLPARKRRHLYRHEWANDVSNHYLSFHCSVYLKCYIFHLQRIFLRLVFKNTHKADYTVCMYVY